MLGFPLGKKSALPHHLMASGSVGNPKSIVGNGRPNHVRSASVPRGWYPLVNI